MAGYNCTVFAYGQTGTGKTFTMEGGEQRGEGGLTWDSDPTSGIIPRACSQIFEKLKEADSLEYSVKVSFLELYNEEIFDLLSGVDDTTKLRLYEDATKKGSVIIQVCQRYFFDQSLTYYYRDWKNCKYTISMTFTRFWRRAAKNGRLLRL